MPRIYTMTLSKFQYTQASLYKETLNYYILPIISIDQHASTLR